MPTRNRFDQTGDRLNAIFLLATLKHKRSGQEFSHTETLSEVVVECLRQYNVKSEIVRLVEYDIPAGTKSNMGKGDGWPGDQEVARQEIPGREARFRRRGEDGAQPGFFRQTFARAGDS